MRPGPGHADKQQSPFFGQIGACPAARSGGRLAASSGACLAASSGIRSGKPEGQQASLAASHEHNRELQALGGMQRQQGDRIGAGVEGVRLRPERDLSEEGRQVVAAATGQWREDLSGGPDVHRGPTRSSGKRREPIHGTAQLAEHGPPRGRRHRGALGRRDRPPGRRDQQARRGAVHGVRSQQPHLMDDLRNPRAALQQIM